MTLTWWDFMNNFVRFGKWTWPIETDEETYERASLEERPEPWNALYPESERTAYQGKPPDFQ